MEQRNIEIAVRIVSFLLWLVFILWVGYAMTRNEPEHLEYFEEQVSSSQEQKTESIFDKVGGMIGTATGKPTTTSSVTTKPIPASELTPDALLLRCNRLEERLLGIVNNQKLYSESFKYDEKIKNFVKWYNASNPTASTTPAIPLSTKATGVEGFAERKVTLDDVNAKVNMLNMMLDAITMEIRSRRSRMEPVYNWYLFKKEQPMGAPLREAFEEPKPPVNAVVTKPDNKPTPEILYEKINNIEKGINDRQKEFTLFHTDFVAVNQWYENTTRLEREQNKKAIDNATADFKAKVEAATSSEASAQMPAGVATPSGVPTKSSQAQQNELTGTLTDSIGSSAKSAEQQAQVAKAMGDISNI